MRQMHLQNNNNVYMIGIAHNMEIDHSLHILKYGQTFKLKFKNYPSLSSYN